MTTTYIKLDCQKPGRRAIKAIVHIPHSSTHIPGHVRGQFVLCDSDLQREMDRMTDWFTDEIYGGLAGTSDVVFPVSRLVVDPERFEHDGQEPMARLGMGVVYERGSNQAPLRRAMSARERQGLIDDYYRPHHQELSCLTEKIVAERGQCFILDGHSFPLVPLPYEEDQHLARPEICIGTDAYHTPASLRDAAVELFSRAGFTTAVNHPFAGAMVPIDFYRTDKRVSALMIEVRRDLYMDERNVEKLAGFRRVKRRIRDVIYKILDI